MPDKPSRSVFVPLLIAGVVVMIGLLLVFVPVLELSAPVSKGSNSTGIRGQHDLIFFLVRVRL